MSSKNYKERVYILDVDTVDHTCPSIPYTRKVISFEKLPFETHLLYGYTILTQYISLLGPYLLFYFNFLFLTIPFKFL